MCMYVCMYICVYIYVWNLTENILFDLFINAMSSHNSSTDSILWVEKITVAPFFRNSKISSFMRFALIGSNPENGGGLLRSQPLGYEQPSSPQQHCLPPTGGDVPLPEAYQALIGGNWGVFWPPGSRNRHSRL